MLLNDTLTQEDSQCICQSVFVNSIFPYLARVASRRLSVSDIRRWFARQPLLRLPRSSENLSRNCPEVRGAVT